MWVDSTRRESLDAECAAKSERPLDYNDSKLKLFNSIVSIWPRSRQLEKYIQQA